jgi:hypothetical protein
METNKIVSLVETLLHFQNPVVLWLLLVLPVFCAAGLWLAFSRRRHMVDSYGDPGLIERFVEPVSRWRIVLKSLVFALCLACLIIALARPTRDSGKVEFPVGSMNVMTIVDVSRSMAVPDYKGQLPEPFAAGRRLDMARHLLIEEVAGTIGFNQIGIVTFAGEAFPQAFVTDDMYPLKWVVTRAVNVGLAPGEGSQMAKAFNLAFRMLDLDAKPGGRNVIVLFSDGGNDSPDADMQLVMRELKARKIDLIVVGLGKTSQSPIPVEMLEPGDRRGQNGKYYQVDGEIVTTRLEENSLLLLKNRVGGRYVRVEKASDFKMTDMVSRAHVTYKPGQQELFHWFLGGAFILLVIGLVLPHRVALGKSAPSKGERS